MSSWVRFECISLSHLLLLNHRYYREGRLVTFLNNISEGSHFLLWKIHINYAISPELPWAQKSIIFLSVQRSSSQIYKRSYGNFSLYFSFVWMRTTNNQNASAVRIFSTLDNINLSLVFCKHFHCCSEEDCLKFVIKTKGQWTKFRKWVLCRGKYIF